MTDSIISHRTPDGRQMPLTAHLKKVAEQARAFAAPLQLANEAFVIGALHDLGKFHPTFQSFIRGGREHTTHAAVGAVWLHEKIPDELYLPMVIAAHHRGLYDCNDAESIVCDNENQDEEKLQTILQIPEARDYLRWLENTEEFKQLTPLDWDTWEGSIKARMLLSCLVDADHLQTEQFFSGGKASVRAIKYDSLATIRERFHNHLNSFQDANDPLNKIRRDIQQRCMEAARGDGALFALPAPTGAGKTLATMAFALEHAKARGKQRLIFAMPYVTIIEQNAKIYKDAINAGGINNVIEHHSNVEHDATREAYKNALAAENWDAPIIVTTFVQFFESLFSHKTKHCKKLHNICNSVVVIDEMQALPTAVHAPVAGMIRELSQRYGVSFLFSTATQLSMDGITPAAIHLPAEHFAALKRVHYHPLITVSGTAELADKITTHNRVLCIVNGRQTCSELYDAVCERASNGNVFHLSTRMCRQHIMDKLSEIQSALESPQQPLYVISTSLVEAGVNLDFPVVYREGNGLDSIVQAAGRCNRNGKMPAAGEVYIFVPLHKPRGELDRKWHNTEYVLRKYQPAPDSLAAIADYFDCQKENSDPDKHRIVNLCRETMLEKASNRFNLIDAKDEVDVIIPYKKGAALIAEIKQHGVSRGIMRRLQRFVVSVPQKHVNEEATTSIECLTVLDTLDEHYSLNKGIIL